MRSRRASRLRSRRRIGGWPGSLGGSTSSPRRPGGSLVLALPDVLMRPSAPSLQCACCPSGGGEELALRSTRRASLYEACRPHAVELGAAMISGRIAEHDSDSLRWAANLGLAEVGRDVELV